MMSGAEPFTAVADVAKFGKLVNAETKCISPQQGSRSYNRAKIY